MLTLVAPGWLSGQRKDRTELPKVKKRKPVVDLEDVRQRLHEIEAQLNKTFVERADAIRVILLATLAQVNYLFVGDPGTAKSSVIDCFTMHVDTPNRFKKQLGKFTQPDHIFGPLDVQAFKEGRLRVVTDGMMPTAQYPILDEVLKSSDGCVNTLLEILQERTFNSEETDVRCVAAATNWPEVEMRNDIVEALFDRFVIRCEVKSVDRGKKEVRRALYRAAERVKSYEPEHMVTPAELDAAHRAVREVEIVDEVIDALDALVGRLVTSKDNQVEVSDRRSVSLQIVLKANAWLAGRDEVTIEDFDILQHGLWGRRKDIEAVRAALDTVDSEAVRDVQKLIDEGRGAYRNLQRTGMNVVRINEVIDKIREIAMEVNDRFSKPVFTTRGRAAIKQGMAALSKDFKELRKQAEQVGD